MQAGGQEFESLYLHRRRLTGRWSAVFFCAIPVTGPGPPGIMALPLTPLCPHYLLSLSPTIYVHITLFPLTLPLTPLPGYKPFLWWGGRFCQLYRRGCPLPNPPFRSGARCGIIGDWCRPCHLSSVTQRCSGLSSPEKSLPMLNNK